MTDYERKWLLQITKVCPDINTKRRLLKFIKARTPDAIETGPGPKEDSIDWNKVEHEPHTNHYYSKRRKESDFKYSKYLETAWWIVRKARALKLGLNKCNRCGTTHRLRVHHITYERLYNERDMDLQVVCETCHRIIHKTEPTTFKRQKYLYKELMLLKKGTAARDKVFKEIRAIPMF